MNLDNRINQKPQDQAVITPAVDTMGHFQCINCSVQFYVYSGPMGLQTLFCGECFNHVKNCITREKNNDYGW